MPFFFLIYKIFSLSFFAATHHPSVPCTALKYMLFLSSFSSIFNHHHLFISPSSLTSSLLPFFFFFKKNKDSSLSPNQYNTRPLETTLNQRKNSVSYPNMPLMNLAGGKLCALLCLTASLFAIVRAEDPYRFFDWNVTYGDIYPLGVRQTVCLKSKFFLFLT